MFIEDNFQYERGMEFILNLNNEERLNLLSNLYHELIDVREYINEIIK